MPSAQQQQLRPSQASGDGTAGSAALDSPFASAVTVQHPADVADHSKPEAESTAEAPTAVAQSSSSSDNGSSVAVFSDIMAHPGSAGDSESPGNGSQPSHSAADDCSQTAVPQAQAQLDSQRSEQGSGLPPALSADMLASSTGILKSPEALGSPLPAASPVHASHQARVTSYLDDNCEDAEAPGQAMCISKVMIHNTLSMVVAFIVALQGVASNSVRDLCMYSQNHK